MAADHQVLERPVKGSKTKKSGDDSYLVQLDKLAAAGGHGVDLAEMTDDQIRARLLGR